MPSPISSASSVFCKPGLERVKALCHALGHPEQALPVIHVAGTNGKGSFCTMLSSILTAAGYRTGRFCSPALTTPYEQITINDTAISPEDWDMGMEKVSAAADHLEDRPTAFEMLTALAFYHFHTQKCDIAVIECGMGGRLDATNLDLSLLLSVVTGVALDHADYLGGSVAEVAWHKGGIARPNVPLLYGGQDETAALALAKCASDANAPFFRLTATPVADKMEITGSTISYGEWKNISLSVPGTYQVANAATVLEAVRLLREGGLSLPEKAVRDGLASFRLPGRTEVIGHLGDCPILYDGAHNPQGIAEAIRAIKAYAGGRIVLLMGVMRDKDYPAMVQALAPFACHVVTVRPDNPRALDPTALAALFEKAGVAAVATENITEGVCLARAFAKEAGCSLFCLGSLYMYQAVRTAIQSTHP